MRGSSPGVPLSWQPAWPGDTGLDLSYSPFDYVFQSEVGHFDWYLRTHIIGELADISFSLRKHGSVQADMMLRGAESSTV